MLQIKLKRTSRVKPHVEFTPLIDCAFTLIIFFAVSTTLISARTGMKLNLPEKTDVEQLPKHVQVSVKPGDTEVLLFFEDLQIKKELLGEMVRNKLVDDPETAFVLAADPQVIYDSVIEIIDIINQAGGKKLALQLEEKRHGKNEE